MSAFGRKLVDEFYFDSKDCDMLPGMKHRYVAHDLIKAVYIGTPDKSSGKRRQSISICYDFVGFIPLDELIKQETA